MMSDRANGDGAANRRIGTARGAAAAGLVLLSACSSSVSTEPGVSSPRELDAPPESMRYLGQPPPGETPQSFAPGIVNTEAVELNAVFAPDGRELLFSRQVDGVATIFVCRFEQGAWSAPRPLSLFPARAHALAVDMTMSQDGEQLLFTGQHPHELAREEPGLDLWLSTRSGGTWSTASVVPAPVSTEFDEIYPVFVADGSVYFSSNRPGGLGSASLYRAQRLRDGSFGDPQLLPRPINDEAGIGDSFIDPAERWIVFSSRRAPSQGRGDLFVSFRAADGAWGEPRSLGPSINTAEHEYCPMLSPDGRFLFFSRRYGATRETTTGGDVFWVDARVIERLR